MICLFSETSREAAGIAIRNKDNFEILKDAQSTSFVKGENLEKYLKTL